MYFAMELKHNPSGMPDIDDERERREEMMAEFNEGAKSSDDGGEDEEVFDAKPSPELEALLPYYNQVEEEALKVARKYFKGTFIADSKDVHKQKLFEYDLHGHTYRCYVDIYNENEEEINIIEVKAITSSKYKNLLFGEAKLNRGPKHSLFIESGNIWRLNTAERIITADASTNFDQKKLALLDRYSDVGKYPHDLAFQKFVIEHTLRKAADDRPVNYYLAVLNNEYVYDGAKDASGKCVYDDIDGQEIITFLDMNEICERYQPTIKKELAVLESYLSTPHDILAKVPVGKWCAWGKNTECGFLSHCFNTLRGIPETNRSNAYINFRGFKASGIDDKFQLINEGYHKLDDVPEGWLVKENHKIQRDCYVSGAEFVDKDNIKFWFDQI